MKNSRRLVVILKFMCCIIWCNAQQNITDKPLKLDIMQSETKLNGEYLFQRQELVAGFSFSLDGSFSFFYSYGASDRRATGTYSVSGDTVILSSNKKSGQDFIVSKEDKEKATVTIQVKHENPMIVQQVLCVCRVGEAHYQFVSDNYGYIDTGLAQCDQVFVQHLMFPDAMTLIKDVGNTNSYFEIVPQQILEEVSFLGINFKIEGDTLTCIPNYFLPFEGIAFVKHN